MDSASNQGTKYFVSKTVDGFFINIHDFSKFIIQFFKEAFTPPYEVQEVIKQCYQVGYKSLSLITLTAFITGIVFTKHSRPALADFGATSWLPSLIGIAIMKALAPLITGLICAGKVGSQMGAELGSEPSSAPICDPTFPAQINPVINGAKAFMIAIPINEGNHD